MPLYWKNRFCTFRYRFIKIVADTAFEISPYTLNGALVFVENLQSKNTYIDIATPPQPYQYSLIAHRSACIDDSHQSNSWLPKMLMCRTRLLMPLLIQAGISLVTATTCYKYPSQIGDTGTDEAAIDVPCDPFALFQQFML